MSDLSDVNDSSVLIVDDNEHNREYARQVLAEHWPVRLAEGGAAALRMLREGLPALMLLDLSMPEVDGWAVIEQVRSELDWSELPVVACSAHAMRGDRERALASGFDAYLTKPFRPAELLELVSGFLGAPSAPLVSGRRVDPEHPASLEEQDDWGDDDWKLSEEDWKGHTP